MFLWRVPASGESGTVGQSQETRLRGCCALSKALHPLTDAIASDQTMARLPCAGYGAVVVLAV